MGKVKDETKGVPIKGFVGLKSKMYAFITEGKHESKRAKHTDNNVVYNDLKYENQKNVLFNRSYMRHEMKRIQSKGHNIESYRTNNFFCLLTMIRNMYLQINIVDYHIFINLFVHDIKINFVEYRQFVLILTLVRTIILFSSLSALQQLH